MNEFLRKKWEMAGLADDYIFNKVMLDYDICLEVLRRILPDLHIKKIKLPNNQQEFAVAPDAKAVRFDIYTTDEQGNHYDIEMQLTTTISLNEFVIIKRLAQWKPTIKDSHMNKLMIPM